MPRPKRRRHIMARPQVDSFGPAASEAAGEITLSLEEFEAIRLIDHDGMDQSQAADVMGVSRQTVGRILKAGRSKVARALVEGLSLRMSGGCYKIRGKGQGRGPGNGRGRGRGRGCGKGRGRE
ncbi:MAG: DUF134 domain-containing protein [Desulfobacter sp.]|nr:MAG: DUF134 domain-containing protein [Desulfobacter sp.]